MLIAPTRSSGEQSRHSLAPERLDFISFLQTGRKIPIQQKFDMKCTCSKEVIVPESGKIPVDIPVGKCAATDVVVQQEGAAAHSNPPSHPTRSAPHQSSLLHPAPQKPATA